MQLWSDEIEAMRPKPAMRSRRASPCSPRCSAAGELRPEDPIERAEAQRAIYAKNFTPSPEMTDREGITAAVIERRVGQM